MENESATLQRPGAVRRELIENPAYLLRHGILKLAAMKESDVRILTAEGFAVAQEFAIAG